MDGERRRKQMLSKDDILKAQDIVTETVAVPEWGGEVLVRGLSGQERDIFEAQLVERRGKKHVPNTANVRAKLVAKCIVDVDGNRLFTDGDVEELGKKSAAALERVATAASRLSGMTEDEEEDGEDFPQEAGNGSSSTSPQNSTAPSTTS